MDKKGKPTRPKAKHLMKLANLAELSEARESKQDDEWSEESVPLDDSTSDSLSDKNDQSTSKGSSRKSKSKNKKGKKIVSGKLENVDEADIIKPVKYPHSRLDTDFVKKKMFEKLSFHLLVAGELEIIDSEKGVGCEKRARIGILTYLAYHFTYLGMSELSEQYDALMKQVERG